MPPKVQKTKAAKALAAQSAGKAGKKKRWTKGKLREKRDHRVVLNKVLLDKMTKEIPKKKVITIYNLIEGYKINGSVARRVVRQLEESKAIKPVCTKSGMWIYTGSK
eukprot:CAMPEP_0175091696 /NCGR_PEP_ID=MMETSP0086_2-20121207/2045_1 /TAXON_ID=136419 /ORGANISM="Unknown Unknown, Strain D1" /LENGTH=106 /DNA_ID=CAMNT_0016364465 /DNA_START=22 /DNA_END=342 /DNA_ORIENTATION=+